jgi:hypothetical protein
MDIKKINKKTAELIAKYQLAYGIDEYGFFAYNDYSGYDTDEIIEEQDTLYDAVIKCVEIIEENKKSLENDDE